MVSNQLDISQTLNTTNLQNLLETNNPSYAEARILYNNLLNEQINPLTDKGLARQKETFLILLLEIFLKNTDLLINQNLRLENNITILANELSEIKTQTLEPIIIAGNKITNNLHLWESGFQQWNKRFDSFETIFETWNLGFNHFEEKIKHLETQLHTSLEYWAKHLTKIEVNFEKLEQNIFQWNHDIEILHSNINRIGQTSSQPTTFSLPQSTFKLLSSNKHNFKF